MKSASEFSRLRQMTQTLAKTTGFQCSFFEVLTAAEAFITFKTCFPYIMCYQFEVVVVAMQPYRTCWKSSVLNSVIRYKC